MTITTRYQSKKIGNLTITITLNKVTITTNRLILTSLNQYDNAELIVCYTTLFGNAQNVALFCDGKPWSEQQINHFVTNDCAQWNDGDYFGAFVVHRRDNQQFIGSFRVNDAKDNFKHIGAGHRHAAEIGYVLDAAHWRQGYGTEIAIAGKKYIKQRNVLMQESHVDEIVATVHPDNIASKMILTKALKKQEAKPFIAYGDKPRLLFFKTLSPKIDGSVLNDVMGDRPRDVGRELYTSFTLS